MTLMALVYVISGRGRDGTWAGMHYLIDNFHSVTSVACANHTEQRIYIISDAILCITSLPRFLYDISKLMEVMTATVETLFICRVYTVRCRYNAVIFQPNSHNRYSISPRLGCLLRVQSLIYVLLLWLQHCVQNHDILYLVTLRKCISYAV